MLIAAIHRRGGILHPVSPIRFAISAGAFLGAMALLVGAVVAAFIATPLMAVGLAASAVVIGVVAFAVFFIGKSSVKVEPSKLEEGSPLAINPEVRQKAENLRQLFQDCVNFEAQREKGPFTDIQDSKSRDEKRRDLESDFNRLYDMKESLHSRVILTKGDSPFDTFMLQLKEEHAHAQQSGDLALQNVCTRLDALMVITLEEKMDQLAIASARLQG